MQWFVRPAISLSLSLWLMLGGLIWIPGVACGQARGSIGKVLWALAPAYDAASIGLTADQLVEFAEHLMRQEEYFRAVSEYRRFLFLYPNDPRCSMVHFRIGLAFYRGHSYEDASQTFAEVAQRYPATFYGQQAWLWRGESLIQQGRSVTAEQLYTELSQGIPDTAIKQQALYQKGWALLYRRQWHDAATFFERIPSPSPLYTNAQQLARAALQGASLKLHSPLLAGIFSGLLPGGGQLYIGRIGDALLAFFLNGLFIAGIVQATQHKAYGVAGVLSVFEAGWYTGNIYGAVSGAHKKNRYNTQNFLRNLENQYRLPLPDSQPGASIGLGVSLGF